jgi:hypothetical protein
LAYSTHVDFIQQLRATDYPIFSDDPKPSRDDIEMMREIKVASEVPGITIHDDRVIGRGGQRISGASDW